MHPHHKILCMNSLFGNFQFTFYWLIISTMLIRLLLDLFIDIFDDSPTIIVYFIWTSPYISRFLFQRSKLQSIRSLIARNLILPAYSHRRCDILQFLCRLLEVQMEQIFGACMQGGTKWKYNVLWSLVKQLDYTRYL